MLRRRLPALLLVVVTSVAVYTLGFQTPPGPRSLRAFAPDRVASLEREMWQAYYQKQKLRLFGLLVVLGVLVALAGVSFVHFREDAAVLRVTRTTILPPDKTTGDFSTSLALPALSPDGNRLVFGARGADGKSPLWVRSLEALTAQPLAGTEGASFPFWSPDSQFIGFFDVSGGRQQRPPSLAGHTGCGRAPPQPSTRTLVEPGASSEGRLCSPGSIALSWVSGGMFSGLSTSFGTLAQSTCTRLRIACRYPSTRGKVISKPLRSGALNEPMKVTGTSASVLTGYITKKLARMELQSTLRSEVIFASPCRHSTPRLV